MFTEARDRPARVAVVAHFDPLGEFAEPAVMLSRALRDLEARVVVVSTVATPHDALAAQVAPHADALVTRANEGFDFLSWQRGLELATRLRWSPSDTLLTNTSMYGPLLPLRPVVDEMSDLSPVWGMTESLDFARHIQSWWLGYDLRTARSERFRRYWSHVRPSTDKWGTILAHELRWARDTEPPGRPARAFVPVSAHCCRRNPLFFAWRGLVAEHGLPFIKRSLFLDNHDRIDMSGWRDFLAHAAPAFDVGVIERDLVRLGRCISGDRRSDAPLS